MKKCIDDFVDDEMRTYFFEVNRNHRIDLENPYDSKNQQGHRGW